MPHKQTMNDAIAYIEWLRTEQATNFLERGRDWCKKAHEEIERVSKWVQHNKEPIILESKWYDNDYSE